MQALVAVAAYPSLDGKKPMSYVHSRNLYYVKNQIEVTVLSFSAKTVYEIDGIPVITVNEYQTMSEQFDVLICHAPNLKNHYRFLLNYGKKIDKQIFVFHGHEILHNYKYYPAPYDYMARSKLYVLLRRLYDDVKLSAWRKYFTENINKANLIFVSQWLYQQFLLETHCDSAIIQNKVAIIANSIGSYFETHRYQPNDIKYDFITIRSDFDKSSYCMDVITRIAVENPKYSFCIVGRGKYFEHYRKPDNIHLIMGTYPHEKLAEFINSSRFALMLTREDSHGLMACELASYGIPLITSDIEICREVFSDCPNATYISNTSPDLESSITVLCQKKKDTVWQRYGKAQTIMKEMQYIKAQVECAN